MGLVFCSFGFPKGFYKTKKSFEKAKKLKKTKENQKHIRKNQITKFWKVSGSPLDMGFVFFVFGFPESFYTTKKLSRILKHKRKPNTLGNTKKQKKTNKPISKGGSETFKHFVFQLFLMFFWFLWFSLVFLFSRRRFWFCKNLWENQKNKNQTHIQGWVWNL